MAESIISFLLPKLDTLLSQEYTLLQGLKSEVQYIRDELESMHDFLRIAEAKQDAHNLDAVQTRRVKQVREVAYDAEDVVDEFLLRFAHPRGAGIRGHVCHMYTSVKNLRARHQIVSKIRDIKDRVEQIAARYQRYRSLEGISETSSNRTTALPMRGDALLFENADLVGIEGPKSVVKSFILTEESHLKAISVVGMGGLGKSTLIKRVYEDPDVIREFSSHAKVTISETFIIDDVLKDLIRQLFKEVKQTIPSEVDSMKGEGLREPVKDFLKNRRYVIVLDDLWKLEHWNFIKNVFPNDNCGSRIIITTRIKDVATTCCHELRGKVHEMQYLSTNDSWELFCKKTFVGGNCPPHLEEISRNIMSKCEGLPLGIVAIGGLLITKDTSNLREWDMVLRSLGGELEGVGKLDQVRKILFLSYNDMPYYLKSCLLYMGVFSEDESVDTGILINLWIAEGFVEEREGMTNTEVAESYLNELISRSLIQVASTYIDGSVYRCRVHDLTYKIILSKCKEHNIVATTISENIRRLVVDQSTFLDEPVHLKHLRTLIVSRKSPFNLSDSSLTQILKGTSKLLKVLHLESPFGINTGSRINTIPKEVFKFYNLTYLNLDHTDISNIPKSIKNLQNLEYLSFRYTNVKELPSDIITLKKLSHLRGSVFKAPHGLASLCSLRELSSIEADGVEVILEIGMLTQLRVLSIREITRENGKELCSSLEKLTNLQQLNVQSITPNDEILDLQCSFVSNHQFLNRLRLTGGLTDIPAWVPLCHGLSELDLIYSRLRQDPLRVLEGLPNLALLRLNEAYIGDTLNFTAKGFQKLKRLHLNDLSRLKSVTIEEGGLPYLETLYFRRCTLLKKLPQGIQYLSKLRTLRLDSMSERLKNKLRSIDKESDEYKKIAHITQIGFGGFIIGKYKVEYLKR